jgi:protocatechuate 3,4-dioxygenase beta subunit
MESNPNPNDERLSRRSLVGLGGLAAAALAGGGWKAREAAAEPEAGSGPAAVASGAVSCVLTPEQTEGPYYIDGEKVRRDITDGRPGVALTLRTMVVDVSTCKVVKGAAVDIWHCDALGVYSGFGPGARSRTFMRGIQRTDAKGVATFETVYPGWYQGRTVHIHVKVHLGGTVVHTGQLYFPEGVTDTVYNRSPYRTRPDRTTRNADDSVFRNGGKRSMLTLSKSGSGYVAAITMGVHRG